MIVSIETILAQGIKFAIADPCSIVSRLNFDARSFREISVQPATTITPDLTSISHSFTWSHSSNDNTGSESRTSTSTGTSIFRTVPTLIVPGETANRLVTACSPQ